LCYLAGSSALSTYFSLLTLAVFVGGGRGEIFCPPPPKKILKLQTVQQFIWSWAIGTFPTKMKNVFVILCCMVSL